MKTKSKSKSKNEPKKTPGYMPAGPASKKMDHAAFDAALASFHAYAPSAADRRKELLAQVAGSVVAGLATTSTPSIATPSGMATVAVDIAEEILKKSGIAPIDTIVDASSPPSGNAEMSAAS
jgi:hypothetical protein